MTTYTSIPNTSIDTDSPLTEELFTLLRDNPLAIQEGDASAPRIQKAAFETDVGTWDIIETLTVASSGNGANINFDHADNANYDILRIVGNCNHSSNSEAVTIEAGNGGTYDTSGYSYIGQGVAITTGQVEWAAGNTSSVLLLESSTSNGWRSGDEVSIDVMISAASRLAPTLFAFACATELPGFSGYMAAMHGSGVRHEVAAHDIFRLVVSSGEWQNGEFIIMGLRNS